MPIPLQLAVQGGGAKLIALLAAMEAVEELDGKEINVKRLCGTSAGAIVACLYAAGVKMEVAKIALVNAFQGRIDELFPLPGNFGFGWSIWKRREIWSADPVRRALEELFAAKQVKLMRDLAIPTAIVCSDLTSSMAKTYSSWNPETRDTSVVRALLDSMALPFFFRVWNDNGNPVIVDGGICNNLPSSVLLDEYEAGLTAAERSARGEVYGISFPPDGSTEIKSARDFAFALVNTAIDSAIQREKNRLGDRVHEIRTSLTTLAFDEALRIDPAAYREIKKGTAEFFQNHASGAARRWILHDLWKEQNLALLQTLWRIYKAQNTAKNIQYQKCRLVWVARGLQDPKLPDDMDYSATFKVGAEPLHCQAIGVTQSGATFLGQMEFSVFDAASDKAVPYETLPARNPDAPLSRKLLFYYLPALPSGGGPFRMRFREAINDFSKTLTDTKRDEFVLTPNRADGNVGMIELILQAPANKGITYEYFPGCAGKGEEMKNADFDNVPPPPFGFENRGWRVKNWPGDTEFGVNLTLH